MSALSTKAQADINLTHPGIAIRRMTQDDLPQVKAIDQISFNMPWPDSAYHYELNENPLSLLWVAEQKTPPGAGSPPGLPRIVGMIVVWMILDEAHIATIAVHPDYRSQGIARQLLAQALITAIERGANQATLEVRAGNIAAQKLYQRFRFAVVGNRPRYYKDNHEDALIMTVSQFDKSYADWLQSGAWNGACPNQD